MSLLKKENWFICALMLLFSLGSFAPFLASSMNLLDKDAWYSDYRYWLFGFLCLILPGLIMILVFVIEMSTKVAFNLGVKGSSIYYSPYTWIILFIIPIIGWVLLIVMYIYIEVFIIVKIKEGNGEKLKISIA